MVGVAFICCTFVAKIKCHLFTHMYVYSIPIYISKSRLINVFLHIYLTKKMHREARENIVTHLYEIGL